MTKESSKRSSKRSSKNIVAKSIKKRKKGRERVAGRTQKLAHAKACKQVVGRT